MMGAANRRAYRRNGTWLVDHGFTKLGIWFYDIAKADWEMELTEIDKARKRIAKFEAEHPA